MSDSLQPCGLQPTRLLCPWDSPGKNTGVGSHSCRCMATTSSSIRRKPGVQREEAWRWIIVPVNSQPCLTPHPLLSSVNPMEGPEACTPRPQPREAPGHRPGPAHLQALCCYTAKTDPGPGLRRLTIHRDLPEAVNVGHARASGGNHIKQAGQSS